MRNITLFAFTALLALNSRAQVIFESGFEDWANNLPTDWMGVRTNLPASGVAQVTENVFEGQSAVRLTRATSGHQRFSTTTLSVEEGQSYEVSFQVRGQGQIRLGLYDGRPTASGYATYTPYTDVTGNVWTAVTLTIAAAVTTNEAEFILSIQNTAAPEHLVVDDVTISLVTVTPPPSVSIRDIQESQAPDGASPLVNETVSTGGVVTALASNGFFIQNGGGPWSGIFVFSTQNVPARGDSVTFTASVTEFFGMTQLQNVNNFLVVNQGNTEVVTTVTAAMANTETYEGVLCRVLAATCTNADIGNNQWAVNDGSATLSVDKLLFNFTPTQGAVYNITGPTRFSFDTYRIMPRDAADIEVVTGLGEEAFGQVVAYPNPASDMLFIDGLDSRAEVMLTDAAGRVVRLANVNGLREELDLSGVAAGSYVLQLRNANGLRAMRIEVVR